jgi:hypothetical protein
MSIKAAEVGKVIRYFTNYDMSAKTSLEIHIIGPEGTVTVDNSRISLSATPINDPDIGVMDANTYMIFSTEATDFPVAGEYTICGVYNDATPRTYYGDKARIMVEEGC